MSEETRAYLWKRSIGFYYLFAIVLRPGMTCHFPWQDDDLLLFGVIPFVASLLGLTFYRNNTERLYSWMVFALAIAGIALSYIPLRYAIGWR